MSSQTVFIEKGSPDTSRDIGPFLDSTDGTVFTTLAYNSTNFTCYYRRGATGTLTQLTLATQTVGGTHTDGGFVAVGSTYAPGMYRFDFSDAILATGEDSAIVVFQGVTDLQPHVVHVVLTDPIETGSDDRVLVSNDAHTAGTTVAAVTADVGVDELAATALADLFNTDSGTVAASAVSGSVVAEIAVRALASVVETEGSVTLQQAISLILSNAAGETSNGGATLETPNGNATRIVATINGSNERTAVTITPSS